MDKITRILLLFSKLLNGEKINKLSFCMETDSLPRTFDRDIEDIRLFLSEIFLNEELVYNRLDNVYYFSKSQRKPLESTEYLFLERVLLDTRALRLDEMHELMKHILQNTERFNNDSFSEKLDSFKYNEPLHKKALLKMNGDLSKTIKNKAAININYIKMNEEIIERKIIPCLIRYDLGYLYLIAFLYESDKPYPAYFRLDRIHSFSVIRSQTSDEKHRVNEYIQKYSKGIVQMYGGEFMEIHISCNKEYYPYIHDKFRDLSIVNYDDNKIELIINAFEDGFVKWIMNQPSDLITVLSPDNVKKKIINEANKLLSHYLEG